MVIQLTNTNEAATQRALADLDADSSYEELDTSPRGILMDFVERSFPVWEYEQYTDENGNIRPLKPAHGSPKKVDGILGAVMGLAVCLQLPAAEKSVFDGDNWKALL